VIKHATIALSEVSLNGIAFRAHPSGALWQAEDRILIVADLHLEKGSSLAQRRGTLLPPYDTRATLQRLDDLITHLDPKIVIALGDTWHDNQGPMRLDDDDRSHLSGLTARAEFVFIAGNHDANLVKHGTIMLIDELHLAGINFRHEPRRDATFEIAGHLHPAAKVKARGRAIRRRCFIANSNRIILPAFGAYAGGLNICNSAFTPLFPDGDFRVHLLSDHRTYAAGAAQVLPD
jgi:DNA ligase-associated metallophosphoesterase